DHPIAQLLAPGGAVGLVERLAQNRDLKGGLDARAFGVGARAEHLIGPPIPLEVHSARVPVPTREKDVEDAIAQGGPARTFGDLREARNDKQVSPGTTNAVPSTSAGGIASEAAAGCP